MKIYADFNGIKTCSDDTTFVCVDLTSYGTLASLNAYRIILTEGLNLDIADPDGLTVTATAYFDKTKISKTCSGWFARFKRDEVMESHEIRIDFSIHLCFTCRKNLKKYLAKVGRQYKEICPFYGTPIMLSLADPRKR